MAVLTADGVLQHWRERATARAVSYLRDDLAGWYVVGADARFDLSDLDHLDAVLLEDNVINIALSDEITLCIVKPEELPNG